VLGKTSLFIGCNLGRALISLARLNGWVREEGSSGLDSLVEPVVDSETRPPVRGLQIALVDRVVGHRSIAHCLVDRDHGVVADRVPGVQSYAR
jgi:hypothetical protein